MQCHRSTGSLNSQVCKLCTITPPAGAGGLEPLCLLPESDSVPAVAGVNPDTPYCPDAAQCWFCKESYCSTSCRQTAWQQYHRQLCPVAYSLSEDTIAPVVMGVMPFGEDDDANEGDSAAAASSSSAAASGAAAAAEEASGDEDEDEAGATPNAVELLHAQARAENEVFFMAAKVIAHILSTWRTNGHDMVAATSPYRALIRQPWWEVVLATMSPEEQQEEGWTPAEVELAIKQTCTDTLCIMKAIFVEQAPKDLPLPSQQDLDALFDLTWYASLIGGFELNVMAVKIMNPVKSYAAILDGEIDGPEELTAEARAAAVKAFQPLKELMATAKEQRGALRKSHAAHDDDTEGEDDDEDDDEDEESEDEEEDSDDEDSDDEDDFPWASGMAVMPIASTMDHSCTPNVAVEYPFFTRRAGIMAQRDIAAGEPIFMSYIENEQPLPGRRRALAHYGFQCRCPACESEGGAGAASSSG